MYFAIMKIGFSDVATGEDGVRALKSLAEKLRSRFKVCAAVIEPQGDALAITALGSSEEKLSQALDSIVSFCEGAGVGRVESEDALLDHIDCLADLASASDND